MHLGDPESTESNAREGLTGLLCNTSQVMQSESTLTSTSSLGSSVFVFSVLL